MKNKILGVVAVTIGIVEAILTMQLVPSFIAAGDPGPKVFPMISAVLFVICGIAIFFQKEDKSKEKQFMTKEQWKRLGILLGVLVVYALLMYFFVISRCSRFDRSTFFLLSEKPPPSYSATVRFM